MDIETKLWIIITIVILITLRTIIDLVYSVNYNYYAKKDSDPRVFPMYLRIANNIGDGDFNSLT